LAWRLQLHRYMKYSLINQLFEQANLLSAMDDTVCNVIDSSLDSYKYRTTLDEQENCYVIHAQVPGLSKEDINITLDDNILKIRGEKAINDHMTCSINKELSLGRDVNSSKITAKVDNGILEVSIPKLEKCKTKQIKIN